MPNSSALSAVQDAVFDRLKADSTLGALTTVLGYEPEAPPDNFIVVGSGTEEAWHTLGGTSDGWGWNTTITVHCYSYYKGDIQVLAALARVVELLNFYALPVSGYTSKTVMCEYGEKITKVLIETKDKRERRHAPVVISVRVHD